MEGYHPPEPDQPEASEQPQGPEQYPDRQLDPLSPPDPETLPGAAESLAAWQKYAQEPPTALGEGVTWRPGQSVSAFWRDAARFIASIVAQEAHEHPDDPEAQATHTFWLEEVQKREE